MRTHRQLKVHAESGHGKSSPKLTRGFTLVELLVVIALMVLILSLALPSLRSMKGAGDVTKAAYDVIGVLEEARAYAIANNTYAWVGFTEVDQSVSDSAVPQKSGVGRVAMAAIGSKDGTKIYDESTNDIGADWSTKTASGAGLMPLGKLVRIDNLHLSDLGQPPAIGKMARPGADYRYRLGNASCASVLGFTYPLGKAPAAAQYTLNKVIQFDPQGTAKIIMSTNYSTIVDWMEIGLQQTHGNMAPTAPVNPNGGNQVALQVDGLTGAVKIYRP